MAIRNSFIVYRKEMREALRDKRVVYGMIISPLLIFPLLMGVMGYFIGSKTKEAKEETLTIGIIAPDQAQRLTDLLKGDKTLEVTTVANVTDAQGLVRDRKLRAAIEVPTGFERQVEAEQHPALKVYLDQANDKSRTAVDRIKETVDRYNKSVVEGRLTRRSLSSELLKTVEVKQENIAESGGAAAFFLSIILPYMIVLMGFFGGSTIAFDTAAGEKERGTLETLLVSAASRSEIVFGKFLSIFTVCTVAALLSIVGLIISFRSGIAVFGEATANKFNISYPSIAMIVVVIIPLTVLFASILLAVSTFARNQKEAQTYFLPLTILVTVPAALSFVLGAETPLSSSVIPLVNGIFLIKQTMLGIFDPKFIALALASSALYAGLGLMLSLALFNREEVLFRS